VIEDEESEAAIIEDKTVIRSSLSLGTNVAPSQISSGNNISRQSIHSTKNSGMPVPQLPVIVEEVQNRLIVPKS
jgi:hypothetical protein